MDDDEIFDVAIGYGPVGCRPGDPARPAGPPGGGARAGTEPYPLPRRHYDHEAARILQSCGVAERCATVVEPAGVYEFQNAEGKVLVRFGRRGNGPSGWPSPPCSASPELRGGAVRPGRGDPPDRGPAGWPCRTSPTTATTSLCAAPAGSVRARYVVGCDGANSTVRSLTGITMVDQAFFYDWLVVDVVFHERACSTR